MGGYIVDAYDQAMCTEGNYSCLWFQFQEHGRSAGEIYQKALEGVLARGLRQTLNQPEVLRNVVQFLFGEEEDLFWSAPIAADDGGQQAP